MITDILISAGGRGTRMKHLSQDIPKHLLEVEGRPFLHYVLDNVMEAGFTKIFLVIGHKKEKLEEFVAKHSYPIILIDQYEALPDKYGTACPVMCAEKYLTGKQFVSIAGDNYYSAEDLQRMREHDDEFTYVGGLIDEHPEEKGVLVCDDKGILQRIAEKPKEYVGNLVNTSLYKFTPDVFDFIKKVEVSSRGEYEITDVITALAKEGKAKVQKLEDGWLDFGRPDDIKHMADLLKGQKHSH